MSSEHICSRRGCSNATDKWSREMALISKVISVFISDRLFGRIQDESRAFSNACRLSTAIICGTWEGWLKYKQDLK